MITKIEQEQIINNMMAVRLFTRTFKAEIKFIQEAGVRGILDVTLTPDETIRFNNLCNEIEGRIGKMMEGDSNV